jgi:putative nucleotidyltransferase with HDIG domain
MFVLPLLLITFVLLLVLPQKLVIDPMMYSRVIITLIIVSGVFGYFLIRKTAKSILDIIRSAKNVSEGKGGNISALHDDELKDLAMAFNKIAELSKNIENTYYETLITLARVVQAKDPYTKGHLERVEKYVDMMADKLRLDDESKKVLKGGALLHDLGKVGISDEILHKDDTFDVEEYAVMKQHPIIGENILKPLRTMEKLSSLVRHHHEWYDGSGYPDGLKGKDIPTLSRILTIADIYDALTTERPYKKAMLKKDALDTLKSYSGNKVDPELVNIFLELMK